MDYDLLSSLLMMIGLILAAVALVWGADRAAAKRVEKDKRENPDSTRPRCTFLPD